MTNDGNPNVDSPVESTENDEHEEQPRSKRSWLLLAFIAVVLVAGAVLGVQLFGILYAIIFPPNAPLPDDITELRHENFAYGADRWVYGTNMDGCFLLETYAEDGASCNTGPGLCGPNGFNPVSASSQRIGTCIHTEQFSIFEMRYEVHVTGGYAVEPVTRFELIRDIFWTGPAPETTEVPE